MPTDDSSLRFKHEVKRRLEGAPERTEAARHHDIFQPRLTRLSAERFADLL